MDEARLQNYMEILVEEMMPNVVSHMNICLCERCKMDILANALNQLPARYVVSKKGQLFAKINAMQHQFDVDIITALTRAASLIGANPRHEN
jgi:competence protein ComFB